MDHDPQIDPRRAHRYWPCFCEENVWHLAADLGPQDCQVLFITNALRQVPMWAQRAVASPDQPTVWDYHVVLLHHDGGGVRVHDLDSTLPWALPLDGYLAHSFDGSEQWPERLQPRFRVLDAGLYRERFWSDRSHMRDQRGAWLQPPPSWPPRLPDGETFTLTGLLDLSLPEPGRVLDLEQLRNLVSHPA